MATIATDFLLQDYYTRLRMRPYNKYSRMSLIFSPICKYILYSRQNCGISMIAVTHTHYIASKSNFRSLWKYGSTLMKLLFRTLQHNLQAWELLIRLHLLDHLLELMGILHPWRR